METTALAELLIGFLGVALLLGFVTVGVLLYHRHRTAAREHLLHEDLHEQRQDIERREHRITEREERLDTEQRHLDERAHQLGDAEAELEVRRAELLELEAERRSVLESVAGLTAEDAHAELMAAVESDARRSAAILVRDIEKAAADDAERNARKVLATTIQRLASDQTSESVVAVVHLPSDDMKGRVIGRE